jgi:hypothetical protein
MDAFRNKRGHDGIALRLSYSSTCGLVFVASRCKNICNIHNMLIVGNSYMQLKHFNLYIISK